MKKILLTVGLLGAVFTANTQVILSENFDALNAGDLGTDPAGGAAGQGGWYTYAATGATNADWQIVAEGSGDNALQLKGNPGASATTGNPSKTRWSSYDLTSAWTGRTSGNNVLWIDYVLNTGGTTTSLNTFSTYTFSTDQINIGGFQFVPSTKVLKGVVYKTETVNNTPTAGVYSYYLGSGGTDLVLPANTEVHLAFTYNKTTGEVTLMGQGNNVSFNYSFAGAASGKDIADFDILAAAGGANNASSATINYDEFFIETKCAIFPTDPTFTAVSPICSGATLAALPTSSTNTPTAIVGTWAPALDNTATTTYTFTPNAGVCANTATMTITVNPIVTPSFTQIAPICSGETLTLPTSSIDASPITGTWSPSVNNTATTNYTFTPSGGSCANTTTMSVTVNQNTTPTFSALATTSFCAGATAPVLATTSDNAITGTWSPSSVSNSANGTYVFTPSNGVCATSVSKSFTFAQNVTPTFSILSTICSGDVAPTLATTSTNSITGTWSPSVVDNQNTATYTFTPTNGLCATTTTATVTVNSTPTVPTFSFATTLCSGAVAPTLPTTSTNSITGTWSPSIVDNTNTGTYVFTPSQGVCASTTSKTVTVNQSVTPTFNSVAAICTGETAPVLPLTSTNSITGTWNPSTVSNTTTGTYTFTASSGTCVNTAQLTVTVNPTTQPTFNFATSICSGATAPVLPSTSNNSIAGTWNPSIVSNLNSGSYMFTPTNNTCVSAVTVNVTVGQAVTPTFAAIAPICLGATAPVLPSTSTNSISGTWSPTTVSNLQTANYTFTPSTSCASNYVATVIVSANTPPTFTLPSSICSGATAPVLPTTSIESIPGTWTPSIVSNTNSGTYVFTPQSGVCATTKTATIIVSSNLIPSFSLPAIICANATPPTLPTSSLNAVTGTWSPATVSNTTSATYLFTPTQGSCATLLATQITVNSCAGIEEIEASKFSIFPNPANDVVSISFSNFIEPGIVNLISADGKLIETRTYSNSSIETFNVETLNPGVYFFQIGNSIEKIVIQ